MWRKNGGNRLMMGLIGLMVLSLGASFWMTGCGGDDGDDVAPLPQKRAGVFYDSVVQGLGYASGSTTGFTDANGRFTYEVGQRLAFYVGGIVLGRTTGQGAVTPLDLVEGAGDPAQNQTVINILRFLQTLDADGDPDNGIVIDPEVTARALDQSLDFTLSDANFTAAAQAVINDLFPANPPAVVTGQAALAHFYKSMAQDVVTTTRDDKGVWFIKGDSDAPMFAIMTAMGYNVAVDRLWQGELYRRQARGQMAEIFGPSLVQTDVFIRTISYSDAELEAAYKALDVELQQAISGYAAGFNARIDEIAQNPNLLPFEFQALGFSPAQWTTKDVMSWLVLLQRNFDPEALDTTQLDNMGLFSYLATMFPNNAQDMFDDLRWINDPDALTYIPPDHTPAQRQSWNESTPDVYYLPDYSDAAEAVSETIDGFKEDMEKLGARVKMGSYAWVADGSKTQSGNPIIYSGPQMGFSTPSIVQECSIQAGGLNVSGMTVTGIPGIIIGRTPHHAWSMQVANAHTTDFYIEIPADVSLHRTETIKVAGGNDVTLPVYRTKHGPVVNPMPYDPAAVTPTNPIISWKYSHWGYEVAAINSFLALAKANSVTEFGQGIEYFAVSQHFCYADRDGNIGYWMSGRDPVRPAGEWRFPQGFAGQPLEWDADQLVDRVHAQNPDQGYFGGWNNKSNPEYNSAYNASNKYFGPFNRAHVVDDYLKNNNNLTFEQLRDLALNIATTSSWEGGGNPWKFVKPYFEPAFSNPTQAQQDALDLLNAWDGHFVAGGSAQWPAGQNRADAWVLMYQWCVEAMRLTFQDELGNLYDGQSRRILFNVFLRGLMGADAGLPLNYNWFLNVLNDQNPSTADEIVRAALDNVLASLGPRPWGENQRGTIPFVHSMLGEVHSIPFSERSTYAHCVEYDTTGPVRIESMFPLGQSGDILSQGGQPVFDKNFFSMTPVYDYFAHRQFPLFD